MTNKALVVAEAKAHLLNAEISQITAAATEATAVAAALAAAKDTQCAEERSTTAATAEAAAKQLAGTQSALRDAERVVADAKKEVKFLHLELERSRTTEATSRGVRRAAEEKAAELQGVAERAEREHALFRERAESRLGLIQLAFDEEEKESGTQVGWSLNYHGAISPACVPQRRKMHVM